MHAYLPILFHVLIISGASATQTCHSSWRPRYPPLHRAGHCTAAHPYCVSPSALAARCRLFQAWAVVQTATSLGLSPKRYQHACGIKFASLFLTMPLLTVQGKKWTGQLEQYSKFNARGFGIATGSCVRWHMRLPKNCLSASDIALLLLKCHRSNMLYLFLYIPGRHVVWYQQNHHRYALLRDGNSFNHESTASFPPS